jgi:hypothetical protein
MPFEGGIMLTDREVTTAFNVRTSAGTGTCFLYQDGGGFLCVSAAHVFRGVLEGERIFFATPTDWLPFEVREIVFADDGADVVCFIVDLAIGDFESFEFGAPPHCWLGAELKFLGFPHGLQNNYPSANGFVTPLVRTAFFSGNVVIEGETWTILDGFNNPGYSGGPVYCWGGPKKIALAGLISGFRNEQERLGQLFRRVGADIEEVEDHFVRLNSGMIYMASRGDINSTALRLRRRILRRSELP